MEHIYSLLITYKYFILFPLACFEGPLVAFVVGMLVAQGYFNPMLAYIILIFGDIIPDSFYYFVGRYGVQNNFLKKYVSKIGAGGEHFTAIKNLWFNHTGKTMFFSKLAYGLSTLFLISAGLAALPFQRFLLSALIVTLAQYALFLIMGYRLGNSFDMVSSSFQKFQIGLAAVLILAIAYYLLTRFMRTKLLDEEGLEEKIDNL